MYKSKQPSRVSTIGKFVKESIMAAHAVRQISECFVKPKYETEESKLPHYLSPWDLAMLSFQYIQKGILFAKPSEAYDGRQFMESLLERLKDSLSVALVHFYPLAGRLTTILHESESSCLVFVDCNGSPGAKFIHSTLDMTILEILSPPDVPLLVQSFFDHDRAANHDGHTRPLVSIQVTELLDGVFIGCSMNHAIGDGTAFWNFFNAWSEIFQAKGDDKPISRLPIVNSWFPEGHGPKIYLPFTRADEFVSRFEAPPLRERMFHVSSQSIAKIKRKANSEYNTQKISSFQSLSALLWRCITRARIQTRRLKLDQSTNCKLATNNRTRLEPPLPEDYFGNCIQTVRGVTTAGELLDHDLGWTAWMLHQAVVNHNDKTVRDMVDKWIETPVVYQIAQLFDPEGVMMGSSPRFNMYGNEFGMGKGVALRSGYAHKFDGGVTSYPGYEGGGSIDLEICLPPDSMTALESDQEFIEAELVRNRLSDFASSYLL